MTQGEEHRHGASSGEFRRKLDLSHRSDLAGPTFHKSVGTTNSRSVAEVLLPPTSRPSIQQNQGGEDARNLLQFVNHASCDIKAVLDQGGYTSYIHHAQLSPLEGSVGSDMVLKSNASPTRHFSPVDLTPHHLKRNIFSPHHHGIPHHHHHHQYPGHEQHERDEAPKPLDAQTTLQRRPESFSASNREQETRRWVDNSSKAGDTVCHSESKKHRDTDIKSDSTDSEKHKEPRNLDLFRFVDMMRENAAKENGDDTHDHSEDESSVGDEDSDFRKRKHSDKNASEANRGNKEKGISSVPLRKRRLPASFWQEPKGKSENHRIQTQLNDRSMDGQPRSFVHHPGLSLFGQLKLPIPGPLSSSHFDFDLGLGRPFGAEKNPFLYPSTSSTAQYLNMPYRPGMPLPVPHGVDDHHRHGLAMPCGNSVCMCHLQTHLGVCASAACEPPSPQNPHQGLFGRSPALPPISPLDTSPSSSLALGRWGAMQSPDGMGDLLGGYHLPRVLKPIPTKSLTSYPPRFHPVFT